MEPIAKLIDGAEEFLKVGDTVTRKYVVSEQIILRGSAASLDKQIQTQEAKIAEIQNHLPRYYDDLIEQERNRELEEVATAQEESSRLKALWKAATGKDYPDA